MLGRGQAWGIYEATLSYNHTGDYTFLETAKNWLTISSTAHQKTFICYWDLVFHDGSGGEERDTFAAAIAVCGLLELAKQQPLSDPKKEYYQTVAIAIMKTQLSTDYTSEWIRHNRTACHLKESMTKSNKGSEGVHDLGDYYYVEALIRLQEKSLVRKLLVKN